MTAKPTLRPYQQRVVDSVFAAWDAGLMRPAISAATGSGKSVMFGEVARRHLEHHRGQGPVALIAHRKELITQAAGHFRRANPDLRVETVIGTPGPMGSSRRAKALTAWRRADVLVASVQTLGSPTTLDAFPDPSLVIADEAHHAAANSWHNVLMALGCWSVTRALGVTATPFREDYKDFSDVWQAVVASVDIAWLINHRLDPVTGGEVECAPGMGYLIPPTLRHLLVDGLDLSQVPTSRKSGAVDFREGALEEEMHRSGAFDLVAKTVLAELADRKGVLFAPTVASSVYLAETLTQAGAPCHHVDGTMDAKTRDGLIGDFREGTVRWLSNVNIVSEGFDLPDIDAVVLARPTRSRIFFRQSIGRALRPSPGKTDAIVLDVAGVSDGHSLAGVEALTDADTLEAMAGEGLSELLDRSARERQGRYDRIMVHKRGAEEIQRRAERAAEQVRLTAEGLADQLPGLAAFAAHVGPMLDAVQDQTTSAVDFALLARPDQTLDELAAADQVCGDRVSSARNCLARLDGTKAKMREALTALREDPEGELAKAVATGTVATVRGTLFGAEDLDRADPKAPTSVRGLQVRGAPKEGKPTHPNRYGWAMRTDGGTYSALVHGEGQRDPVAITAAVPLGYVEGQRGATKFLPVWWDLGTGETRELAAACSEEEAYGVVVRAAADETTATNLLNPAAAWRKKSSPPGSGARAMAMRVAPGTPIPDNATAGFVSDVINHALYSPKVEKLAAWVREQVSA